MNTYLALFLMATACSLCLTPVLRRFCQAHGWVDVPSDDRHIHRQPIPRLGGVAIFVSVMLALSSLLLRHNLVTEAVWAERWRLLSILVPSSLIFLIGVVDDLRGMPAAAKFGAQCAAALLFYFMSGGIRLAHVPFLGDLSLGWLASLALTLVWVVAITNAFNLIDGVDGLAAGAGLFAAFVLMVVALVGHHTLTSVISVAFIGAIIGFLRYNFHPASIFLGDSGSLFMGSLLATVSAAGSQKASTAVAVVIPLLAFGVPLIDTSFAIVRRILGGRPIFEGDREHLHHKLLALGWSQRRVVWVFYAASGTFALVALLSMQDPTGRITGLVLLIIGAAVVFAIGRLQYHEIDELGATVQRAGERRERRLKHIVIRRAAEALGKAETLSDVFCSVVEVMKAGRFASVTLQLADPVSTEAIQALWAREARSALTAAGKCAGGVLCWSWRLDSSDLPEAPAPFAAWKMCIPLGAEDHAIGAIEFERAVALPLLVNLGYISGFYRAELSQALMRMLGIATQPAAEVVIKGARATG